MSGIAVDGFCTASSCPGYDAGIAPSSVTIALQDLTFPTTWWNGVTWVDSSVPIWSTAAFVGASSGTWSYSLPPSALTSLRTYGVTSRARDSANNQQVVLTTNTFSADFANPLSRVTVPVHGGNISSLPQVSGTALDSGAAGISRVYLAYYKMTAPAFWWNKSTKAFDLPDALAPPDAPGPASNYWVEASTDNGSPVNWYATGTSTPAWQTATTYEVLSVLPTRPRTSRFVPTPPQPTPVASSSPSACPCRFPLSSSPTP